MVCFPASSRAAERYAKCTLAGNALPGVCVSVRPPVGAGDGAGFGPRLDSGAVSGCPFLADAAFSTAVGSAVLLAAGDDAASGALYCVTFNGAPGETRIAPSTTTCSPTCNPSLITQSSPIHWRTTTARCSALPSLPTTHAKCDFAPC